MFINGGGSIQNGYLSPTKLNNIIILNNLNTIKNILYNFINL